MFKRYRANYSLWPEQARPRRRPLRFAIGSFALGVVCATAYGVVFGFSGPVAGQVPAAQSACRAWSRLCLGGPACYARARAARRRKPRSSSRACGQDQASDHRIADRRVDHRK